MTAFELNAVDYLLDTPERSSSELGEALAQAGQRQARRVERILVRLGISELEAQLDPTRFIRIRRSVLVNLDFVESMTPDDQSQLQIQMRDGTRLGANREASRVLRDMSI